MTEAQQLVTGLPRGDRGNVSRYSWAVTDITKTRSRRAHLPWCGRRRAVEGKLDTFAPTRVWVFPPILRTCVCCIE